VRTEIGAYNFNQSHSLEQIENMFSQGHVYKFLLPVENLLPELPKIVVNEDTAKLVRSGCDFAPPPKHKEVPNILRIFDSQGNLIAFAKNKPEDSCLHPFLVFAPNNSD
jgi:tRNA U55 pseudouridine synthase TruB